MEDLKKTIIAQIEKYVENYNIKDVKKAVLVCHPDCYQMPPGRETAKGREAIQAAVEEYQSTEGWDKMERTHIEVEQFSPTICMSYSTYNWFNEAGTQGGTFKALIVWKKEGEEWLAYRAIFNAP